MEDYQKRMVQEQVELMCRVGKLQTFVDENKGNTKISPDEKARLRRQLLAMNAYLEVLTERISVFNK